MTRLIIMMIMIMPFVLTYVSGMDFLPSNTDPEDWTREENDSWANNIKGLGEQSRLDKSRSEHKTLKKPKIMESFKSVKDLVETYRKYGFAFSSFTQLRRIIPGDFQDDGETHDNNPTLTSVRKIDAYLKVVMGKIQSFVSPAEDELSEYRVRPRKMFFKSDGGFMFHNDGVDFNANNLTVWQGFNSKRLAVAVPNLSQGRDFKVTKLQDLLYRDDSDLYMETDLLFEEDPAAENQNQYQIFITPKDVPGVVFLNNGIIYHSGAGDIDESIGRWYPEEVMYNNYSGRSVHEIRARLKEEYPKI